MKESVTVTQEQIKNKTGVMYRASGNLFIGKKVSKTVPTGYSGVRGDVVRFSSGSGCRMRRYLRECTTEYRYMVTLTYPYEYPSTGRETKEHLRRFLQELQREDKRRIDAKPSDPLHSAFWFLEFQGRGAPHYHIFTNRPVHKTWCSKRWYEIVNSEDERHLRAGTRCEALRRGRAGTISYASKYAAKQEQKEVPAGFENVGRFWGVYGYRVTMSADTFVSRSDMECSRVRHTIQSMMSAIKLAIIQGKAEEIKRENGVLIVVMHDKRVMQDIRRKVSLIESMTTSWYNMFSDAELDYGELFNG